ncbi:hypothetical protein Tco_0694970 [Tanacetum coccineum]
MKDNISSCSDSEEQEMQQMQKKANILKENFLNKFNALQSTTQRLERETFPNCLLFQQAFLSLFSNDARTFTFELFHSMNNLEKKLDKETIHEKNSKLKRLNERKLHIQECKNQEVKAADASFGDKDSNGFYQTKGNANSSENDCSKTAEKQSSTSSNESSRSGNKCRERSNSGDDTDLRPSYDTEPMAEVPSNAEYNVFTVETQHTEQPESINDTNVVQKVDSNVIPDSSGMCDNDNQANQNAKECDDKHAVLANLITNLKLDIDENKKIQKQSKKANISLAQELKKCKSILKESNRTRDRYLGALHDKEIELAKYKRYNDCTIEKDSLERKLKETIGLLAQHELEIKEVLKMKGYEISVVKEKNDELVK